MRRNENNFYYNKSGSRRIGISHIHIPVKTEDPNKKDRKNRNDVVNEINKLIENGSTLEDACKALAAREDISSKFTYLPKESLSQIFAGWYNGRVRNRKEIERYVVKTYENESER